MAVPIANIMEPADWQDREMERLEAENAMLRTFLGGGSIVTDYWKDEDGTMHVLTTDGEHAYEYMRGGLADENAKLLDQKADAYNDMVIARLDADELQAEIAMLKELLRDMAAEMRGLGVDFKRVGWCDYADRMRELGVEV